jgi:hypothetical protein
MNEMALTLRQAQHEGLILSRPKAVSKGEARANLFNSGF